MKPSVILYKALPDDLQKRLEEHFAVTQVKNLSPETVAQHAGAFARAEGHVAPRRGHLAAEHFEERGLPRPVGPDHTVAVARGEFEIDILEKNPFSVLHL